MVSLFCNVTKVHWAFDGTQKTEVWGINGSMPGPTIKVKSGDDVKLIYSNRLNEPVSMTKSGLLVPGTQIGGAARDDVSGSLLVTGVAYSSKSGHLLVSCEYAF